MSKYPVYEEYDVIDGKTIFKDDDWWKAAVLYEGFGSPEVAVYLWKRDGDNWSRKQKYVVKSAADWADEREAIDGLVGQLSENEE